LDGEATECRLCKHCGCMLITSDYIWLHKSDYIWLHKSSSSEKIDPHRDQKQEINFVWPNYKSVATLSAQESELPKWDSTEAESSSRR